jgi:hypothetical protein
MSANWIEDIETMHHKYGVNERGIKRAAKFTVW